MLPKQQFIRGVALETSANKLQSLLDRQNNIYFLEDNSPECLPQLSIADFRLPRYLEDLGIFCVGSPGSGKTQAISKLISQLKQRSDFRIVCFDRNGEFTRNFYDEERDLLFNPDDARSVGWCHNGESASHENIAASIIPLSHHEDKFWGISGRNLLAEIYQRVQTNSDVWYVMSKLDSDGLKELLSDSIFNKYFESEKTFSSIVASTSTYTRFYKQLGDTEHNLDFTKWARKDDPRSLFLPLFEENTELYKPLYSMVFNLIVRGLLSNPERNIKTAIIIDELGALQPLESLSRLLAEGRKFKACPIIATQTTAQIDKIYGGHEKQILLQGTATKLILNCRDPRSALEMAEIIGYQEVLEEFIDRSDNSYTPTEQVNFSTIREKYTVMPSEIQSLQPLQGFLVLGNGTPVINARLTPRNYPIIAERLIPLEEN